ncbi:putative leucine-rich repeat-containing protein DDB_G0290503 isoform X2 [Parasteatoda tepidariorum]|uniref:putative leucine-rich repeat-containing protein DDB_G0290503 isoform X2 n=1 Tax=Parasteatoda tepidariorum TaxID=114398 RepID=UPI001C71FD68|nr:protein MLP2 [Parasteatoda tepidariorum]
MIHEKKKQSLLSWVQSAGGHDVTSFSQLSDGKLLNELVVTLSDKDSDLSYKAEIEPKETSSDKPPRVSVGDEEQHELTKETVDSSIEKMESIGQEQEVVNGFHDSGSNELDSSGMFSCSDIKTEEVSENGNILESNSELMKEITAVCQVKAEDNDKQCISVDSCMGVSVNGSAKMDCSASQEDSNSVENVDDSDVNDTADSAASEIQSRYNVVQRFIESMLELQCETLVNFPQCLERNELELAKLTILLLSAMVQYSLSTKKDHIMASCYSLSQEDQEEIMDCLEIFLKERQSPIEHKEFHSRLSRRAKLRISPRKHCSSMSTPQFNKPTKRGRKRKAFNAVEEFLDKGFESPIQNLIQSPDIRHITPNSEARLLEAVRCKDKTIASLTYDLDMEKFTGDDLKKQNEDLSSQLSKLKKENKLLKEELSEIQANLENSELAFEKSQKDWKNEVKNYKRQIKDLKEAEKFWKESNQVEDTPKIQKIECTCSEEIGSLKCALQAKDDKIQEFQKQIEILNVQLDKLSQENKDLNSQLEENVNSDNKTSCGRLPTQEKCFNISDLSLRNELKDKCEELQNDLKQMEIEYSVNIRSLEELLSQKDKIEKECKAKLRKSDKEREDAINNQKKLEIENSNLKGQIEVFKNMLPEISSPLVPKSATASNSTPANRRSSRNRNACDSEKIGQLWQNYDDETEDVVIANISKTRLEPDETSCETITTEPPPSENRKVSEKSQNKLCRSQSVNNVTSTKNTCNICSQNDFCEVPPLIQNLCKIVREDNILDTDVLLELHKYERDFYMNDLVRVLTLLTRILLKDDGTCGRSLSKYRKDSGSLDLNSEITFEPVSKTNEPEQPRRKSVQGRRSGKSSQHSDLDAGSSKSDKSLEKSNSIPFYRELLRREKRKVTCLQTKLKVM